MDNSPAQYLIVRLIFSLGLYFWFVAYVSAANVVFWIQPRSNTILDRQVTSAISSLAGQVALRANMNDTRQPYTYSTIVSRFKEVAPDAKILAYAWGTCFPERGLTEATLLKGRWFGDFIVDTESKESGKIGYFDEANPEVRKKIVQRLINGEKQLGVDGLALDLSMRTPYVRPKPLATVCQRDSDYCKKYAQGMDDLFASLRASLGQDGYLVYNGLWNFEPGMLADQVKLLANADSAAIEYFGMNPRDPEHSFSHDVLPYLRVMSGSLGGKSVLVFGRGPWHYTDYLADYRWQRYLYTSFLLATRRNDLFKYHASFQVPAHKGRAGGLDIYEDWHVRLGNALGSYTVEDGLYRREFAKGMVFVAPDDGTGGKARIPGSKYAIGGDKVSGEISLHPGEGLLLLNDPAMAKQRAVMRIISAQTMASWGWSFAELMRMPGRDYLRLHGLPVQMEGEHDLMLDYERSLSPYQELEIKAKLSNSDAAIIAVAEIDDPNKKHEWLELEMSNKPLSDDIALEKKPINFRTRNKKHNQEKWPVISVPYKDAESGEMVLNGPELLAKSGYRFRRWSHLRFEGDMDVSSVALGSPIRLE